jgi:hypothetical protein
MKSVGLKKKKFKVAGYVKRFIKAESELQKT